MTQTPVETAGRAFARSLKDHWKLFLAEGILFLLLGCAALLLPLVAGLAITILLGWLFLLLGAFGLATTFAMRHMPGFWWSLISGVITVLLGGLLLVFRGPA